MGEGGVWNAREAGALEKAVDDKCVSPFHISPRVAGRQDSAAFPVVWALSFGLGVGSGFWALRAAPSRRPSGSLPCPPPPIVEAGESEKMVVSSLANSGVAMPSA